MAKNMIRRPFPRGGIRTRLPVTIYRRSSDEFSPTEIEGLALWLDASSSDLYTTDAGPVVAVASPLDIAGCVGWWDASDAGTLKQNSNGTTAVSSEDDPVGYWADKSESGFNVIQATPGLRPLYKASGLNGKPSLLFDGSDDALRVTPSTPIGTAGVTVFAVFQVVTAGTYVSPPLLLGSGPFARPYDRYHASGSNIVAIGSATSVSPTLSLRTQTTPFIHSMTVQKDGASSGVHRFQEFSNGAGQGIIDITSTYSVASQVVSVGARADSATLLNARVSEIVLYDGVLTTAQRASVESYLAAKWSIAGVHAPATASSDPVGYWADKSGNGRHAVQATAGRRGVVGTLNSRRAITFDGTDDCLTASIATASLCSTDGGVAFYVAVPNSDSAWAAFTNSGPAGHIDRFSDGASYHGNFRNTRFSGINAGAYTTTGAQLIVSRTSAATGLHTVRKDGATIHSGAEDIAGYRGLIATASLSVGSSVTSLGPPVTRAHFLAGSVPEVLCYSSPLTDVQVRRIETYLATRWGITLAPQVSNADAQNWIDRVYANGGTVSSATAGAVNTFCDAIDAASLRAAMYRTNLFCGGNLNAALVPLYRGPSLGGTQYGGTTDTNEGGLFVTPNYNETGASGGLQGASASSKRLRTGLAQNAMPTGDLHIAAYEIAKSNASSDTSVGARNNSLGQYSELAMGANTSTALFYNVGTGFATASDSGYTQAGGFLMGVSVSTALTLYKNGSSAATGTVSAAASTSSTFAVFSTESESGTGADFTNARLGGYSIGLSMTAGQAAAYYTAMQAFQTSLTRNV